MKAATIHQIKNELSNLDPEELLSICIRLSKYKKENKELLSYLLFDAGNEEQFIVDSKREIDELFREINTSNLYYAKKGIRKILRIVNKHIKYSGKKTTELELLIYFCNRLSQSNIMSTRSVQLTTLYERQKEKIDKALKGLDPDLQYDYQKEIVGL